MLRYYAWPIAEQVLARLPLGHALYRWLGARKHRAARTRILPSSLRLVERSRRLKPHGGHALDVGTAWYHRDAFLLYLVGDWRVTLFDVEDKATLGSIRSYVQTLVAEAESVAPAVGKTPEYVREQLAPLLRLTTRHALYEACRFTPAITRATDRPMTAEGSVDLIVSNCVLNHIRLPILEPELRALAQTLKPDGVMNVLIGHDDHWSFHDPSMRMFEYYRFSDRLYRVVFETPFEFQNRMVWPEWQDLLERAGIHVLDHDPYVTPESRRAIASLPTICARFIGVPLEQLAIIHSYVTLARACPTSLGAPGRALGVKMGARPDGSAPSKTTAL